MSERKSNRAPNQRLPWPMIGAALTALLAFHVSVLESDMQFRGLAIVAALILLSQFIPWRLPKSLIIGWVIRAVVFILIISSVGIPKEPVKGWFVEPHYTTLAGYLLAAEFALRCWIKREAEPRKMFEALGVALVLTALIMTAASNTFPTKLMHIHLLAPVYCLMVALSLRSFSRVGFPGDRPAGSGGQGRAFIGMRWGALLLALTIAGTSAFAIARYEQRLTSWAIRAIEEKFAPRRSQQVGFGAPKLERVDEGAGGAMGRVAIVEGSLTERHLRMLAFDTYVPVTAGQRPQTSWTPAGLTDRTFRIVPTKQLRTDDGGDRLHITLLSDTLDILLTPMNAGAIETPETLQRDSMGAVQFREPGTNTPYDVAASADPDFQGPLSGQPDATQRQALLAIPAGVDPRVITLAKSVAGDGDSVSRLYNIIQKELWKNHKYSLHYTPPADGDPLNDFILNHRDAHCQYFASAMVIMSRAVGIPARFVTGYYLHEPYGDNAMVARDRDAHAWAECWIDGKGWVTVDATPATGMPDELFKDPSRWRHAWEHLTDIPRLLRRWFGRATRTELIALAVGILALLTLWSILQRWRGRKKPTPQPVYARATPQLQSAAKRFERLLRRKGIDCPAQRPWRENLAAVEANRNKTIDRETCLTFVEVYDAARFGGANGQSLQTLTALLEKLEKA